VDRLDTIANKTLDITSQGLDSISLGLTQANASIGNLNSLMMLSAFRTDSAISQLQDDISETRRAFTDATSNLANTTADGFSGLTSNIAFIAIAGVGGFLLVNEMSKNKN
jgi:hypothetical protein